MGLCLILISTLGRNLSRSSKQDFPLETVNFPEEEVMGMIGQLIRGLFPHLRQGLKVCISAQDVLDKFPDIAMQLVATPEVNESTGRKPPVFLQELLLELMCHPNDRLGRRA